MQRDKDTCAVKTEQLPRNNFFFLDQLNASRVHCFSTYAKFSEKQTYLTL